MKGRIIKIISNQYEVLSEENQRVKCIAMGKLRKGVSPVVGDIVEYERFEDLYGIQKIYPRINQLKRPLIANVDQAIVVMSAKDPDFSCALLDRLLFLISYANIKPVICITKLDLIDKDDEIYDYISDYKQSGYDVYLSGHDFDTSDIEMILNGKVSVLTGQSGAGKSSLINRIDERFKLHTQKISKALGRGKHTTRHCELFAINHGWLGDTPGFSSLDFSEVEIIALADSILDFQKVRGKCKFNNCTHTNEPACAVKKGVEEGIISKIRYKNYCEVAALIKQNKKKY
ncbi:MAG: ribosome small subunit-dependent GTPase A [Erysipelotrichia bacterium]|nr:ribosome small subunit-dependent GTPase A [Erysipelotrichia bacterium]NCC53866.1 ribosome small subunit-dependent GTPase A [Erysipelotrichia bacterium]